MRRAIRVAAGVVALAVLGAPAGAVPLRYKFRAGEAHTYKATMKGRGEITASMMPESMRIQMSMEAVNAIKVLSVADDGESAEVEQRLKSGKMTTTMDGETQTSEMPRERVVLSVDTRGRVLQVKTTGAQAAGAMSPAMEGMDWAELTAAMAFPARDLKVGDKWEADPKVQVEGLAMRVHAQSELLQLLSYKGRQCAKIQTELAIPLDQMLPEMEVEEMPAPAMTGSVTGSITWYFDHVNGLMIDQSGKMNMVMKMSFAMGDETLESSTALIMNTTLVLQK